MLTTTDQTLGGAVRGRVSYPGDGDWDAARQAFNLLVDQRPAAVAFPVDERDVIAVVHHATEHGLTIAPQATGHNAGPLGPLDDTLIVNTSLLQDVSIDAAARRVRVGAGTKWEAVIAPLSELGLAALHGSSPDVGIVGYSLGGGLGWLGRRHGLQCNSVTAIELVTADGHLIRTDAVHEPELFWALRGGGGNFGVVTAIEFEVYPVTELLRRRAVLPLRAGERGHHGVERARPVTAGRDHDVGLRAPRPRPPVSCPSRCAAARSPSSAACCSVASRPVASCWSRSVRSARSWTRSPWSRRRESRSSRWIRRIRCRARARTTTSGRCPRRRSTSWSAH